MSSCDRCGKSPCRCGSLPAPVTLAPFAGVGAAPVAIEHDMPTRRLPGVGGPGIDTESTVVAQLRRVDTPPKTEPPADAVKEEEDTRPHPLTEKTEASEDDAVDVDIEDDPDFVPADDATAALEVVAVAPVVEPVADVVEPVAAVVVSATVVEPVAAPVTVVEPVASVVTVVEAVASPFSALGAGVVAGSSAVESSVWATPSQVPAVDRSGEISTLVMPPPPALTDPVIIDVVESATAVVAVPALADLVAPPAPPALADFPIEAAFASVPVVDAPPPPAIGDNIDWMVGAQTDRFNLEDILASEADSLVLGDAGNVVQSFRVRTRSRDMPGVGAPLPHGSAGADAAATAAPPTTMEVFVGGDIARLLAADAVLQKRESPPHSGQLSPFEMFVLKQIDGVRNVGEIQAAMRLSDGDLRIVLALLVDKKLVEPAGPLPEPTTRQPAEKSEDSLDLDVDDTSPVPADEMGIGLEPILTPQPMPAPPPPPSFAPPTTNSTAEEPPPPPPPPSNLRPAFAPPPAPLASPAFTGLPAPPSSQPLVLGLPGQGPPPGAPKPSTTSTTSQELPRPAPASLSPGSAALRAGLLITGDHTKAAALHAQCIRELKNGSVEKAHQLARQALNAAPDITLYRDTLAEWAAFVQAHRTPDDVRAKAQAVIAEDAGDYDKAVALLRQAVTANPQNASAWNRLSVLLATKKNDIVGAVDAAQKAVELVPDDATYLSNFTKFAALADKRGGLDKAKRGLWNRLLGK